MINRTDIYTVLVTYEDGSSAFCAMVENDRGVTFEVRDRAQGQSWYECNLVQSMVENASRQGFGHLITTVSIVRADGGRDDCEV